MPYIDKYRRDQLNVRTDVRFNNAGELNYGFTKLALDYIGQNGLTYQHINDVIGALESCKQEFYRRIAAGYENEKLFVNGDVFDDKGTH